jgi:hypothetical protein
MKHLSLVLFAAAIGITSLLMSQEENADKEVKRPMFLPKPLDNDWTRWIVGEWEGSGESNTGKGKYRSKIELGLNRQFLIMTGEAEITEINPEYLKKNMNATDEEIDRFRSLPYKSLEIYTIDQKTGETIGYMFDSLRCIALGRGKMQGNKEIMEWQWATGHKSTRITEKISDDKGVVIEKTTMPDGNIMEDRGEMIRKKKPVLEK